MANTVSRKNKTKLEFVLQAKQLCMYPGIPEKLGSAFALFFL